MPGFCIAATFRVRIFFWSLSSCKKQPSYRRGSILFEPRPWVCSMAAISSMDSSDPSSQSDIKIICLGDSAVGKSK